MKSFREEFQRRKEDRRRSRSASWLHWLLKIIFFIFVILMIRYFGSPDPDKFRNWQKFNDQNPIEEKKPDIFP